MQLARDVTEQVIGLIIEGHLVAGPDRSESVSNGRHGFQSSIRTF